MDVILANIYASLKGENCEHIFFTAIKEASQPT